jgi:hypothetical protein
MASIATLRMTVARLELDHLFLVAFERRADRLAGFAVPQPRRLVVRCGYDALAVGAERRASASCVTSIAGPNGAA